MCYPPVLYNWYCKLSAVDRWKRVCSNSFQVTRGTKQRSTLSPYLFFIFIDQLLLDLTNSDVGVIISNQRNNCMAYADDVTLFYNNVLSLQYININININVKSLKLELILALS